MGSNIGRSLGRAAAVAALGLCLVGCASQGSSGEPVELLTGAVGCYAGGASPFTGALTADSTYGTAFDGRPAVWPVGYTGWRVGSEVAVVDGSGKSVATTGSRYYFSQPFIEASTYRQVQALGAVGLRDCGRGSLVSCSGLAGLHHFVECGTVPPLVVGLLGVWIAIRADDLRWRLVGVAIFVAAALLGLYVVWVVALVAVGAAVLSWRSLRALDPPDPWRFGVE
jgi:hypothetical protein